MASEYALETEPWEKEKATERSVRIPDVQIVLANSIDALVVSFDNLASRLKPIRREDTTSATMLDKASAGASEIQQYLQDVLNRIMLLTTRVDNLSSELDL